MLLFVVVSSSSDAKATSRPWLPTRWRWWCTKRVNTVKTLVKNNRVEISLPSPRWTLIQIAPEYLNCVLPAKPRAFFNPCHLHMLLSVCSAKYLRVCDLDAHRSSLDARMNLVNDSLDRQRRQHTCWFRTVYQSSGDIRWELWTAMHDVTVY
jgi:hypothetical protein